MPILDGSDDGDFHTDYGDYYIDPDSRWQYSRDTYGGETDAYPTSWAAVKEVYGIEHRCITPGTYQLRSLTHLVTVNQEGFETYMRDPVNIDDFEQWCENNNVKIEMRES